MPVPKKSRILVVDDHPMVREWLAQMINRETDLTVCGEAADAASTLTMIESLKPEMAIVDLTMKDSHGTELVREIATHFPSLPVLVLSMHDESLYAERAMRAGAKGYIAKQEAGDKIRSAIRSVLNGQIYLSEAVASRIIRSAVGDPSSSIPSSVDSLSEQQLTVMRMIGRGLTTNQIADQLQLSVKTVEGYIARIKKKLNLANATELLQYAILFNKTSGD